MRLYDYAASGNCYKARLLLAPLGLAYERVAVDIFAGDTLTPEFEKLNALRETPVLELDSGETIAQSNAILWYLAEGTEYLPATRLDRARIVQWLSFEQERIMPGLGGTRFRRATGRAILDPTLDAARFQTGLGALRVLDDQLRERDYLVGDRCSIADLSVFAYTHVCDQAGFELSAFPAVVAWLGRVRALPGFVDDDLRYPENAQPGRGRSIYD
ncbi:MAG: glutathione S-transferase family protein [Gaiellaceae bacterium]